MTALGGSFVVTVVLVTLGVAFGIVLAWALIQFFVWLSYEIPEWRRMNRGSNGWYFWHK